MANLIPTNSNQFTSGGNLGAGMFSFVDEIRTLIYGRRMIDAQVTFSKLKVAQQRHCIEALTEIAKSTKDDQIRLQMFQSIWMLAANIG